MTAGHRMWFWSQPLVAVLGLGASIVAWALQLNNDFSLLPSVQSVITASFVLPGLALSLGINHLIVSARTPPHLTGGEKALLAVQYLLITLAIVTSLDPAALLWGFLFWPLLIIAAVTSCTAMTTRTVRERRAARAPFDYTAQAAEPDDATSQHSGQSAAGGVTSPGQ